MTSIRHSPSVSYLLTLLVTVSSSVQGFLLSILESQHNITDVRRCFTSRAVITLFNVLEQLSWIALRLCTIILVTTHAFVMIHFIFQALSDPLKAFDYVKSIALPLLWKVFLTVGLCVVTVILKRVAGHILFIE